MSTGSRLRNTRAAVRAAAAFAVLASAGCKARLEGSLSINGAPFVAQSCRSTQPMGFGGVELADANGRRLRLVADPTGSGQAIAVLLAPGAAAGIATPNCGTLTIQPQNSRVNNVQNVEGRAQLQCATPEGVLMGTLAFGNCH